MSSIEFFGQKFGLLVQCVYIVDLETIDIFQETFSTFSHRSSFTSYYPTLPSYFLESICGAYAASSGGRKGEKDQRIYANGGLERIRLLVWSNQSFST